MSWIEKRKNGKCWIACWKQGSRKIRRSTGIRIEAGAAGRHARSLAEQTAAAMEAAATGETPAHKACDAVRKVAELHGCAGKIPTVREYFADFPRTARESTEKNRTRSFNIFFAYLGTDADRRIDTITPAICRGFVRQMLKQVSRNTVRQFRTYVAAVFKRAVEVDDYLNKNPFAGVDMAAGFDAQVAYNDDPPAFDERTVQQMDALFDVFRAEEGDKEAERRLFKQPLLARFMSPEIRKDEAAREKSLGVVASTMAGVEPWMAFRRLKKNGLEGVDETGSWNRSDYARGVTALLRNAYRKDKAERESQRKVRESTENFEEMVGGIVRGGTTVDKLEPEQIEVLRKGGYTLRDLQNAADAYKAYLAWREDDDKDVLVGKGDDALNMFIATDGADDKVRNLFLSVVQDDEYKKEKAVRESGFGGQAIGWAKRTAEDFAEKVVVATANEGANINRALYRFNHPEDRYAQGAFAIEGAVREAMDAGRQKAKEEKPSRLLDLAEGASGMGIMMVQFMNPATKVSALQNFFQENLQTVENAARVRTMSRKHYDELVQGAMKDGMSEEEARRYADGVRDEWRRKVQEWQVMATAGLYTAADYGSMMMGLGLYRKIPAVNKAIMKGTRGVTRNILGAAGVGFGTTMLDVGVLMPATSGAMKWGADSLLGTDEKIHMGKSQMEAWWDQVDKLNYWVSTAGAGLFGAAAGARGIKRNTLLHLSDRKGAIITGATGEQYDSVMHLPVRERDAKIKEFAQQNKEKDFEATTRRSIEAAREMVQQAQVRIQREETLARAALEESGVSFEPGAKEDEVVMRYGGSVDAKGKFTPGEAKITMSREDADVYVSGVVANNVRRMMQIMATEAGNKRLLDAFKGTLKGEVDIKWLREAVNLRKRIQTGKEAETRVAKRVEELTKEGKSEAEARKVAEAEIHPELDGKKTLGELVKVGKDTEGRLAIEDAKGKEATETRAFVTSWRNADGQTIRRVLSLVNGATVREVSEELAEQRARDFMESNGITSVQAYRWLNALRQHMAESKDEDTRAASEDFITLHKREPQLVKRILSDDFDPTDTGRLTVEEERQIEQDVREGLSALTLMVERNKADTTTMPDWVDSLMADEFVLQGELRRLAAVANALRQAKEEGWLEEGAAKLFDVGEEAVEQALRRNEEPTTEEYHRAMLERGRRQAELDAEYGQGKVRDPQETDEFEARARAGQQAEDEERERREEQENEQGKKALDDFAKEPENEGKTHEEVVKDAADKVNDAKEEKVESDPGAQKDEGFTNGVCVEISDERGLVCKSGVVPIAKLKMMPQFKLGADAETGEVSPLRGDYFADHDPIRVWRRSDGTMMVISGRHRLAHAKRAGVDRISAYVYDESNVYNEAWARRLDIELNIRDNQATALEVAMYVRGEFAEDKQPLTDAQVTAAGIAREGKIGSIGYRIGRNACDSVMDALRNKVIEDSDALAIADFCPGNERVQGKGLKVILEGGSKTEARTRMETELGRIKMEQAAGVEGGTDLFGGVLEDEAFWDFVAKYVKAKRKELDDHASFLRNLTKKRAEELAKLYHVDAGDPQAKKKLLKAIDEKRARWKSPFTDQEIMQEIVDAYKADHGKPAAQVFERYAQRLREWERGVTDYSAREEEKRYRVENDKVGLSARLNEKVQPVEINFTGDLAKEKAEYEQRLGKKLSDVAYYREAIVDALLDLAEKYPDGMEIEGTGLRVKLPTSRGKAKKAQGRARNAKKRMAVTGLEEVMKKAVHLGSDTPIHKEGESKKKKGMSDSVSSFEKFGYPVHLNGEEMLFWFNATRMEEKQDSVEFYEFGVTDVEKKEAGDTRAKESSSSTRTPASEGTLGDILSRVKNKNVVDVKKDIPEGGKLTVAQAQERGMFKDGVMEVSNGIIVAPDTDYSVDFSHVSRALFRKPDKKHVGTGEGNQAYGWGCIYGAEAPGVNRTYHKNFTDSGVVFKQGEGEKAKEIPQEELVAELKKRGVTNERVLWEIDGHWFYRSKDELIEDKNTTKRGIEVHEKLRDSKDLDKEEREKHARLADYCKQRVMLIDYFLENDIVSRPFGKRYPVNYRMRADVDDDNLLHWDTTIAEGRELDSPDFGGAFYGADVIETILRGNKDFEGIDLSKPSEELLRFLKDAIENHDTEEAQYVFKRDVNVEFIDNWAAEEFDAANYNMEDLQYWMERVVNGCLDGERIYSYLTRSLGSPRKASEWLDEHGVRGIKYADGNTRHRDVEKDYNYVIFNPDYIEVIAINNRHAWSEYSEDNPDWQRPEEVFGGRPVTDYSVAGMRARTAGANMDKVYRDPADGKEKFVIPTANARLSTGFTLGQLKSPVGGHKDASLGAILEYPELYEAYPELRGMRVRLYNPKMQDGTGGFFARPQGKEAGYLALNTGMGMTPERVLETLLHESQHAIQTIEGHAIGAWSMSVEDALAYLKRAIKLRKAAIKAGGDDAWNRENLAYLESMQRMVQGKEGAKMQDMAISHVYWYSHGEQEARFTGSSKDGDPMAEGSGMTENSPTTWTIAVPGEATELGGVTFGGMGRFSYLLESRLGTAGDFNYDRAVYQMKEAVVRRMRELRMLGDSRDERARGVQLAAEALATMESLESLLPATYRFGLEAYKVYFSSYAKLAESGSAAEAGRMVPMTGWDERMRGAYNRIAQMLLEGSVYRGDKEFWGKHWDKVEKILPPLQEKWEELSRGIASLRGKERREAIDTAWRALRHELPEEMRTLMQAVGEVRADKLMAKFMERVALQLDAFRKDKTLGKIRRVVGALTPLPGENGKPVKGRLDAERYKKVVDLVRLMELTRGEKELFERERYTGEGTEKAWADLEPNDTVTVKTYDEDGNVMEIACSKEEYETYACFELMTASQAEAASRALGEYISTGRQAWDNAQEAARQRIAELCAPAMEKYGETENEKKARRERQQRKAMPLVKKTLNFLGFGLNDAQFFDACSKVPEIEKWTKDAVYRIASAHTYIEAKERDRQDFMTQAAREASGEKDDKKVREWLDETRRNRDTGIKLVEQRPPFYKLETEKMRLQFMGLLRRKTHKQNFNPNTFAEALRYLTEEDGLMPEAVAREALDKYGTLGDAKASRLQGKEALIVLLTDNEYARFSDLKKTAEKRAEEAEKKWLQEREEEAARRKEDGKPMEKENGTLVLSPSQAAYRVLLCEQADYTESLSMQGYTPEVVQRLREFAGEKVMRMAYALREKMGERTEEIRDMYERVYGMPFPEVENYFRAFFDVAYETRQEGIMSGEGAGYAAGAGTVKILYHRNHRNARIDPTMTMYEAFNAGMKEQDLLLGYGELPSELLRILNYKEGHQTMSDALEKCLGSGALSEMRQHVENMSRLAPEVERYARAATRVISEWSSAGAQMILSWRQGSLVKQLTAFFNGVAGSEYVGVLDYFTSLGKVLLGLGRIKLKDLAERPELKGRFKGWENTENMKAMMSPADVRTAMPGAAVFAGKGMAAMEWLDVWTNVRQAAAIYDAAYRKLRLKVPNATPEELDGLAMREVQHALALKSQPLDWRQRSLGSLKKSPFTIGSFFLGGESVNTFANFARLLAKHEYLDAAAVWLSHGFGLQALTALYNFITDDKEQWEKRSLGGYFRNALLGPLGGVPLLSSAYNEWVWKPFHRKAKWLPYVQTTDLIPAADIERLYREWSKANKSGEWEAYTLACDDTLRVFATVTLLASRNSTGKAGLWAKAGAVIVGGVGNLVDFFVRVERAAKERWGLELD